MAYTTQLVFFLNGALPLQQHGLLVGGRTYAILNYIKGIIIGLLLLLLLLYAVLQFFTRQFCFSYNFASCFVWMLNLVAHTEGGTQAESV